MHLKLLAMKFWKNYLSCIVYIDVFVATKFFQLFNQFLLTKNKNLYNSYNVSKHKIYTVLRVKAIICSHENVTNF